MNFIISRGFALLVVLLLSACSFKPIDPTIFEQPEKVDKIVDETFEVLLAHDADRIWEMLHPVAKGKVSKKQIKTALGFFPESDLVEKVHIGRNIRTMKGTVSYSTYSNSYQLEFEDNIFLFVSITALQQDGQLALSGLKINVLEQRLEETHKFSFQGKSTTHYAILTAIIFSVLLVLATVFHIMMNWKKLRSPIRWLIFSLFGITALSLNWTTGETSFQLLHIGLLGGGFSTGNPGYAPWMLSWYPPIVAALYWLSAKKKEEPALTEE